MLIQRDEIARLIPHGDSMCLLDRVTSWDERHLAAATGSHRDADNPLMENGVLNTVALVEYGAQAAAVHAALQQNRPDTERPAYLGAIRNLQLHSCRVDTRLDEVQVHAQCILSEDNGAIYDIHAFADGSELITGRIVLVQPS